jgi:hypothetical protein
MKELQQHLKEETQEIRNHEQNKVQTEYALKVMPGQKVWEINLTTHKHRQVLPEEYTTKSIKLGGSEIKEFQYKPGHTYIVAASKKAMARKYLQLYANIVKQQSPQLHATQPPATNPAEALPIRSES